MKGLLPLIGLVICVFIFNMSEFMPIGLLTGISVDLSVSESQAGLIISMYAWAVAILSLPLMLVLRKMEYRRMLLMCVALFAAFQALSGISDSYWMLMISRIGVAVAHSIFWSIATPLAVSVVEPSYRRAAISLIAVGTSLAMVIGLPLGRVIGLALGWRMSFIAICAIAVVALILLLIVFPRVENPGTFTLGRVPELFRNRVLMGFFVAEVLVVIGMFTAYSYIEPFLNGYAGLPENDVTMILTVYGLSGIIGSVLFSRKGGDHRIGILLMAFAGSCLALFLLLPSSALMIAVMLVIAFWGVCYTSFNVSMQNEVLKVIPNDSFAIVMALFSALYNVGIATGTIMGGLVTDSIGIQYIGVVGGCFIAASTMLLVFYLVGKMRAQTSTA